MSSDIICARCGESFENGEIVFNVSMKKYTNELSESRGGGIYHKNCAIEWIK